MQEEDELEQEKTAGDPSEAEEQGDEQLIADQKVNKRTLEILFERDHDPDKIRSFTAERQKGDGWVATEVTHDEEDLEADGLSAELAEKGETISGEQGIDTEASELSPELADKLEALKKQVMAGEMELPEFLQKAAEISGLKPEEFDKQRLDRINEKLGKEFSSMGEFEAAVESGEVDIDPQQLEILKDNPELSEFFTGSDKELSELPEPPLPEEGEAETEEEEEEDKAEKGEEEEKINMEEVKKKADWVFETVNKTMGKKLKKMRRHRFYRELEEQSGIDWGEGGKPKGGELTTAMKQRMDEKFGVQGKDYYKDVKKDRKRNPMERLFGRGIQSYDELIRMVAKSSGEAGAIRVEVYKKVLKKRRVNAFKLEVASYALDSVNSLKGVMLNMISSALQAELQGAGAAG